MNKTATQMNKSTAQAHRLTTPENKPTTTTRESITQKLARFISYLPAPETLTNLVLWSKIAVLAAVAYCIWLTTQLTFPSPLVLILVCESIAVFCTIAVYWLRRLANSLTRTAPRPSYEYGLFPGPRDFRRQLCMSLLIFFVTGINLSLDLATCVFHFMIGAEIKHLLSHGVLPLEIFQKAAIDETAILEHIGVLFIPATLLLILSLTITRLTTRYVLSLPQPDRHPLGTWQKRQLRD